MENNAISVIDALCDKFGIMIDWTSQNAVPYLQHLMDSAVKMKITQDICIVITLVLASVFFLCLGKKIRKNENFNWEENAGPLEFSYLGAMILYVVCALAAFVFVIYTIYDVSACVTFPEKVFMDMVIDYM